MNYIANAVRSKGDPQIIQSGQSSLTPADRLGTGLGWFSIALGLTEILAAGQTWRGHSGWKVGRGSFVHSACASWVRYRHAIDRKKRRTMEPRGWRCLRSCDAGDSCGRCSILDSAAMPCWACWEWEL